MTRVRFTADNLGACRTFDTTRFDADRHVMAGEEGTIVEDWKPAPALSEWIMVKTDDDFFVPVHPGMIEEVQ